jgi:hypothetical protein
MGVLMRLPPIALIVSLAAGTLAAHWPPYTTPNVPQTPDAKPNRNGPTQRTPNGRPDLSGIWENKLQAGDDKGPLRNRPLPAGRRWRLSSTSERDLRTLGRHFGLESPAW